MWRHFDLNQSIVMTKCPTDHHNHHVIQLFHYLFKELCYTQLILNDNCILKSEDS